MCLNLARSGKQVVAFDKDDASLRKAELGGAQPAAGLEELQDCGLVFTMLPGCSAVDIVMPTILEGSNLEKRVFVDCSTVSPSTSRSWQEEARSQGHAYLDSPVSGGVKGAEEATLTFMVGSDDADALEVARPYLEEMGKRVVPCGGSGTGSATKLCNNVALAAQMIGICEAMNLGESLGVEPSVLADVINTSTARCWSSEVNNPHPEVAQETPAANDYNGGFGAILMLKDLGLAVSAGRELGVVMPQGSLSKDLYRTVVLEGLGDKDFGVMLKFLKQAE